MKMAEKHGAFMDTKEMPPEYVGSIIDVGIRQKRKQRKQNMPFF